MSDSLTQENLGCSRSPKGKVTWNRWIATASRLRGC